MVTLSQAQALALALPATIEQDHHGRPSFRVRDRIFATVPDAEHLNVMVDERDTHAAVQEDPSAFEELWWGRRLRGVRVNLVAAGPQALRDLLEEAWRRRAPKRLAAGYAAEARLRLPRPARHASGPLPAPARSPPRPRHPGLVASLSRSRSGRARSRP